jgi:hypothetical protein
LQTSDSTRRSALAALVRDFRLALRPELNAVLARNGWSTDDDEAAASDDDGAPGPGFYATLSHEFINMAGSFDHLELSLVPGAT